MRKLRFIAPLLIVAVLVVFALAQDEEDPWAWVPAGGCELMLDVVENCTDCDDLVTILTTDQDQEAWKAYFEGKAGSRTNETEEQVGEGAFAGLTEKQIQTLIDYAAINLPVDAEALPEDPAEITCEVLPTTGKLLTLQYCLSCHPISVPAYEERDYDGWMMLLDGRTHKQVLEANDFTDAMTETMARWLANNTPIPEEDIPEEHRGLPPGY